ncbi:MAG: hypothetical protein AB8B74_07580 [Crocinitomicaceae bacterium]
MKKVLLTALILLTILEAKSQTIINPEWVKTEFGSVNNLAEAWGC